MRRTCEKALSALRTERPRNHLSKHSDYLSTPTALLAYPIWTRGPPRYEVGGEIRNQAIRIFQSYNALD